LARNATANDAPKVLEKALRVLGLFSELRPEWSATAISRELDLPLTTAHRIVRTLESHLFLRRTAAGRYRLGVAAIGLGRRAADSFDLLAVLRPSLEWLAAVTDETTAIATFDQRRLASLCVDMIERAHPVRVSIEIGSVTPLHAGAHGRALLAFMDDALELVLERPLARLASRTITEPRRLRAELKAVRRNGWAFAKDESHDGAWSMASPILDANGTPVASIGFLSPTSRLAPDLERRGAEYVAEAARRGSARLGAVE
jgi:IclR family transcriptional regulator, acetate operon repressor